MNNTPSSLVKQSKDIGTAYSSHHMSFDRYGSQRDYSVFTTFSFEIRGMKYIVCYLKVPRNFQIQSNN